MKCIFSTKIPLDLKTCFQSERQILRKPCYRFSLILLYSGSDERHFLISSTDGGDIYGLREGNTQLEKVLGLRGHSSHVTCVDWSTFTDHGPSGMVIRATKLCYFLSYFCFGSVPSVRFPAKLFPSSFLLKTILL